MDNEKAIVNGVNVKDCQFYSCGACVEITDEDGGYIDKCKEYTDCYFKQLKRKEQECEKLQEQISKIKEYVRHNMFDVDCENWFEIFIYTFEDWKKSILENENKYKQECEVLKSESFTREELITLQEKDINRYRKALEEIEEVLKVDFQLPCASTVCSYPNTCKDSLTNHGTKCMRFCLLNIKNIINKAKEENNGINDNSK